MTSYDPFQYYARVRNALVLVQDACASAGRGGWFARGLLTVYDQEVQKLNRFVQTTDANTPCWKFSRGSRSHRA